MTQPRFIPRVAAILATDPDEFPEDYCPDIRGDYDAVIEIMDSGGRPPAYRFELDGRPCMLLDRQRHLARMAWAVREMTRWDHGD